MLNNGFMHLNLLVCNICYYYCCLPKQCSWLDNYNSDVLNTLSPLLADDSLAADWLAVKTRSLCQ